MLITLLMYLAGAWCAYHILFEGSCAGTGKPKFDRWFVGYCIALVFIIAGLGVRLL